MFSLFKRLPESYYAFWLGFVNLKDKAKIIPIAFSNHWLAVLLAQKNYLGICFSCETIIQTFYALYPIFISWVILSQKLSYFFALMSFWLFINVLEYISVYYSALLEVQCINSIQFNAFKFFLTVDPIYHTMKKSGKLYAKIERCARSYEDFLDIILWDILPMVVSLIAVIFAFFQVQFTLGLVALILLIFIAITNIFLNLLTSAAFENRLIHADDAVKTLNVESLTQAQLIRSSFATDEITTLGKESSENLMYTEGTAWIAFATSTSISRLFYVISIIILGWLIIASILKGQLTVELGTALILTYINGTYEIIRIGQRLRKLNRAIIRIKDLFLFIRNFGKQTFPVLRTEEKTALVKEHIKTISLEAHHIHFDYNPKATIFDQHSLLLQVPMNQPNKLYGIIGPSGMGKTTLLSLLGGQLKPDKGTILLNGISLYDIDDAERRNLITMQGQIASSLSGTVRRNLLLGLPYDHDMYSDEQIIEVLKKVGIWHIFEEKEGLDTPVGESGLTLSGGQRQRLNFSSLYLRAQYYKPLLILIDEPTSSLDEVSERAITHMISDLAKRALTIVIAHRLKTLDDAVGIVDFSLLDTEKNIVFYDRDELSKRSTYYKRLIQGDVTIDG